MVLAPRQHAYFLGLVAAAFAIVWAVIGVATRWNNRGDRSRSAIAFGLGILAIVVNRFVPYH